MSRQTAGSIEVPDSASLSSLSRLASQALGSDPQRVEALRLQFQAGQYKPDAQKISAKIVEAHLDNSIDT